MKKGVVVALSVVGVLVVAGLGAFWYLSKPVDAVEYEESVSAASRQQNADLKAALVLAGITTSLVDVGAERVYVGYDVPTEGPDGSEPLPGEAYQRYVLSAAAKVAPDVPTLKARQFADGKAVAEWVVQTADVLAYQSGSLTADELEAKITKTAL